MEEQMSWDKRHMGDKLMLTYIDYLKRATGLAFLEEEFQSLLGQYHMTHHGLKGRLLVDADGDDDDDDDNQLPSHGQIGR